MEKAEENKAIMRRFYEEVFNKGNWTVADEIVAINVVDHNPPVPGLPSGREGAKQGFMSLRRAFLDFRVTVEDMVAEGDKVVSRLIMTGTNNGEFMGKPPTGKKVKVEIFDMARIIDGKHVERWGIIDMLSMIQQLGMAH